MNKIQFISDFKEVFIDSDSIIIEEDTNFKQLDSWDSLTAMALVLMIQDKYMLNFSEDNLKKCQTVNEIISIITK